MAGLVSIVPAKSSFRDAITGSFDPLRKKWRGATPGTVNQRAFGEPKSWSSRSLLVWLRSQVFALGGSCPSGWIHCVDASPPDPFD